MKHPLTLALTAASLMLLCAPAARGGDPEAVTYGAALINTMGKGDFAPYYLTANRHGLVTQSANVLLDLGAVKPLDLGRRFSWEAGAEFVAGWDEPTNYLRYNSGEWVEDDLHGRRLQIQQLYAGVKFRGVFLSGGLRHHGSSILNNSLSSGDLIESPNAAPLPEVRAGFVDFQDIPFTNGWVQLEGEISYGWFTDGDWWRSHFNRFEGHTTSGSVLNYKRWYFRTKPSERFSVTVGAQMSTIFGGTTEFYRDGEHYRTSRFGKRLKDYAEAFLPTSESEDFRLGNSIGSWDLAARYRLRSGDEVKAYFEWLWEDGSGIGRRNGFDGLWGVEFTAARKGWVDGVVVEYLDFTNQSGPIHWAPGDFPGTDLTAQATGADDYYNNAYYNSYANYGLSIGTPFLKAPLFNTDGYMGFTATRLRGFHAALTGTPVRGLRYRAMVSYRKAWGNGMLMLPSPQHSTSAMVEASYDIGRLPGLNVKFAVALDHGNLLGNNSGAELTVSYTGEFSLRHNRKPKDTAE
ncbi:MAG: capsule assembly Wzi family protein [Clostridium sp.]|nr:capsule assembly Wzi family protein [Clostridium sp.]